MANTHGRREPRPDYFEPVPEYTNKDSPEPRVGGASPVRKPSSPPISDKMVSGADRGELEGYPGVSPDLIAAITEKVTKEVVEHLSKQQSGSEVEVSNKSSSTSSPPPTNTPPSPTQSTKAPYVAPPPMESRSPPTSPLDKPSVRFSDRRPAVARTYSTTELSTIDQKWGRLFDSDGTPTQRLGDFLRGLANHIIEEFPPKKSIVVTPSKMAAYYASYALEKEPPHPLLSIFRANANEEHIQRLYQNLGCEHHLVQEGPHAAAIIPSLTPVGFAHWMTLFILAYPDEEWRRLGKVVEKMPIDADGDLVDGKPERLPKQISRHLLPVKPDPTSQKLLEVTILEFLNNLGSTSRRRGSLTAPSLSRRSSTQSRQRQRSVEIHQTTRTSPTSSKAQPIERERKPYTGAPSTSECSSNEESVKIERDRQPYTAQPGSGKVYTEAQTLNLPNRPGRANSTSSRGSTRDHYDAGSRINTRDQPHIDEPRHLRTGSTSSQSYVPSSGRPVGRRTSSPPMKNFRHSTPGDIQAADKYGPTPGSSTSTFNPGSYGSGSSFPPPPPGPPPIDIRHGERDRRYRDDRHGRRGTDEELRFTGELNSPKDAEKWDRYQEAVVGDRYNGSYERGSVSIDPRDIRGAEDFYREKPREYDTYGRRIS